MSSLEPKDRRPVGPAVTLDDAASHALLAHAAAGFPHEVVGLLGGSAATGHVHRVVPLVNETTADPARRFAVDGRVALRAEQALNAAGVDLLGYYHSHPDHPADWSDTDRDSALPGMVYLIAAVAPPTADRPARVVDLQAWRLREDRSRMDAAPLHLTPAGAPGSR